jgi:glycosyltransferase involved in cell wall biosynthesis
METTLTEKDKRIIFFVPEQQVLNSNIINSQVLAQAEFLTKHNFKCMFIGSEGSPERARQAEEMIKKKYSFRAVVLDCFSDKYGLPSLILSAKHVAKLSRYEVSQFVPTHIYARSLAASSASRKIARMSKAISVLDVRGISAEEAVLRRNGKRGLAFLLLSRLTKRELSKSDRLSCVSDNLKEWIKTFCGREAQTVIPCCVEEKTIGFDMAKRRILREKLGFSEADKVLVYSGGIGVWQKINDTIKIFAQIAKLKTAYRFLFLSREENYLKKKIQEMALPNERCIIKSCCYEKIHDYLTACDAGIIIRDNNIVNNVACPIKIGEYLASGLPVILTKGIGEFSKAVSKHKIGLLLDEHRDAAEQIVNYLEELNQNDIRTAAMQYCREQLTFDSHLKEFEKLYGQ